MNPWRDVAEQAYHAYGDTVGWKNFAGQQMPAFTDLPETIQRAWEAAREAR